MKLTKKSKREKLSLKYNNQKRVREHRRRLKKEARKLGLKHKPRKDPGIPNTWPFKAQLLAELEAKKQKREEEILAKRAEAKKKAQHDQRQDAFDRRKAQEEREAARREKRTLEVEARQREALRLMLLRTDVFLEALDARDPIGCRCAGLEELVHQTGKRLIFVLTKADLVAPDVAARWLQVLGQVAPVVVVQAEAGREGVHELLSLLGRAGEAKKNALSSTAPTLPPVTSSIVGVVGYPGTGKRALCKALRLEVHGHAAWLLETIGRLRPDTWPPTEPAAMLHLAVRGELARTIPGKQVSEPVAVVDLLLARASQQAVMRRFRLATFETTEGFLRAYAADRDLKNKRGNVPSMEVIGLHVLSSLASSPSCFCAPPENIGTPELTFWSAHGAADSKSWVEATMNSQLEALRARAAGDASVGGLALTSLGELGPTVELQELIAEAEEADDADMDDHSLEGSAEGEGEESEEEDDDCEGEESEDVFFSPNEGD